MEVMIMNGISSKDFGLIIVGSQRPLLPEQKDDYRLISGRDGLKHFARELGNTSMYIDFIKYNNRVETWLEDKNDIAGWLYTREEVVFSFDDEPDVYYVGKVEEVDIPEGYMPIVKFGIKLNLHPFKYGTAHSVDIPSNTDFTLTNNGNYETSYSISTTLSESDNFFTLAIDDVMITYNDMVNVGDVVTIDAGELELRVNGELKVLEVDGQFSYLKPGNNTIRVYSSGTSTLSYRERYI